MIYLPFITCFKVFLLFQIISFNMEMCESVLITVVELEGEVKRLRKHVEEEEEELQAQLAEWETSWSVDLLVIQIIGGVIAFLLFIR
jgi:hypothetical protein